MARITLFLSPSPINFRLRMISSMVVFDPHKVEKAIPVVRHATHNLLVSLDAVFDLEILAAMLADKHMTTVLLLRGL